jgi:hypothetical protein
VGKKAVEGKDAGSSLGCTNHQAQRGLHDAEEAAPEVKTALRKLKAFVTYVHHSPQAMEYYMKVSHEQYDRLDAKQKELLGKPTQPVQSVETRWNSVCAMIESMSASYSRIAIRETCVWAVRNKKRKTYNDIYVDEEWSILTASSRRCRPCAR